MPVGRQLLRAASGATRPGQIHSQVYGASGAGEGGGHGRGEGGGLCGDGEGGGLGGGADGMGGAGGGCGGGGGLDGNGQGGSGGSAGNGGGGGGLHGGRDGKRRASTSPTRPPELGLRLGVASGVASGVGLTTAMPSPPQCFGLAFNARQVSQPMHWLKMAQTTLCSNSEPGLGQETHLDLQSVDAVVRDSSRSGTIAEHARRSYGRTQSTRGGLRQPRRERASSNCVTY